MYRVRQQLIGATCVLARLRAVLFAAHFQRRGGKFRGTFMEILSKVSVKI